MKSCMYEDELRIDAFTVKHVCGICGDNYHKECTDEMKQICDCYKAKEVE